MSTSSKDVVRVPVDNDEDIRAAVFPALAARYTAEVGPVPLSMTKEPSMAPVLRWAWRDAARTDRGDLARVSAALADAAHRMTVKLEAKRDEIARLEALMDSAAGKVGELTIRAEAAESALALPERRVPVATDGARLKAAREAAGLSMGELGRRLGYAAHSSVSLVERGRAPLSESMAAWLKEQGR